MQQNAGDKFLKQSFNIRDVNTRNNQLFVQLLQSIEQNAILFDWDDITKNKVASFKMHPTLLHEVNFSIHNSWENNRKLLQEEFGLDYESIAIEVRQFTRKHREQPLDAYRRFMTLIRKPNFNFVGLSEEMQRFTLNQSLEVILPAPVYIFFSSLWIQNNETTDLTEILKLIKRAQKVVPMKEVQVNFAEHNYDEEDEEGCYTLTSNSRQKSSFKKPFNSYARDEQWQQTMENKMTTIISRMEGNEQRMDKHDQTHKALIDKMDKTQAHMMKTQATFMDKMMDKLEQMSMQQTF